MNRAFIFFLVLPLMGADYLKNGTFETSTDEWLVTGDHVAWGTNGFNQPGCMRIDFPAGAPKTITQCGTIIDPYKQYVLLGTRGSGDVVLNAWIHIYEDSDCNSLLETSQVVNNAVPGTDWWYFKGLFNLPVGGIGVKLEIEVSAGVPGAWLEIDDVFVGSYWHQGKNRELTIIAQEDTPSPIPGKDYKTVGYPRLISDRPLVHGSVADGDGDESFMWVEPTTLYRETNYAQMGTVTNQVATNGVGDWLTVGIIAGNIECLFGNGLPIVYTEDPAPLFPGKELYDLRFLHLFDDGSFSVTATLNDDTQVIYHGSELSNPVWSVLHQSGDTISGLGLTAADTFSSVVFSHSGNHMLVAAMADVGDPTSDEILFLDGTLLFRESATSSTGRNWGSFLELDVNDLGDYAFVGSYQTGYKDQGFICFNGTDFIQVQDILAGYHLGYESAGFGVVINDLGQGLINWVRPTSTYWFFIKNIANPHGSAHLVLKTGDQIDYDGDDSMDGLIRYPISVKGEEDLGLDNLGRMAIFASTPRSKFFSDQVFLLLPPFCGADASWFQQLPDWPQTNILGFLPFNCE